MECLQLSLVSGKQIHYVMPVLPIAAILIARLVTSVLRRIVYGMMPLLIIYLLMSVLLFVIPQLSLEGGDREMLKHIPKWIAVVPLVSSAVLLFSRCRTVLRSVKAVTVGMLLLIVCLHLAITNPLHAIYDQSVISKAIKLVQSKNGIVAVSPSNLSDQRTVWSKDYSTLQRWLAFVLHCYRSLPGS